MTDAAGDLLAFARMDDAFAESGLIAIDKCRNVVRFRGAPTDGLYEALAGENAVVRGIANRPGIAAFGGGVAIVVDGHVVGAVGASGGSAAALGAFAEVDPDLMRQVLDEAGKFVGEVIAPLNRDGDEIGARFEAGSVTMAPGFRDAYQAFWQAGWPALACAAEDGGQGLPAVLEATLYEMLSAANHGWTMAPGLLHGAYECIKHHASDELKARYLEKVATGEWLATMCLTEPQAGSDLGLVRTQASVVAAVTDSSPSRWR